jgi:hypothetical protein
MSEPQFFAARLSDVCTELYKLVYGSPPFPFWFLINCIYWSLLVRASQSARPKPFSDRICAFISSSLLVFLTREILATLLRKSSPIVAHPLSVVLFLLIFIIFQVLPDHIIESLVSPWVFVVAYLQGVNHMKLFTLCLRNVDSTNGFFSLILSSFFATFDIILEGFFRAIFDFRNTHLSGPIVWIVAVSVLGLYWVLTHQFVMLPIIPAACAFAVVSGVAHAIALAVPEGARPVGGGNEKGKPGTRTRGKKEV